MLRWVTDVSRGDWVRQRLGPFGSAVGSVVPRGFEAYARVLHRVQAGTGTWARWADVAAVTGRVLHPTAQWWALAGRPSWHTSPPALAHDEGWPDWYERSMRGTARRGEPGEWAGGDPEEGALDAPQLAALVGVLRGVTEPDAVTVAFWDGSGWQGGTYVVALWGGDDDAGWQGESRPSGPDLPLDVIDGKRLALPGRDHILFAGSLDDVAALAAGIATADVSPFRPGSRTPSLLWPGDRSWCVATEVDFDSTLVGGPRALVDAVLADGTLEAFEVHAEDSLGVDDDEVNR